MGNVLKIAAPIVSSFVPGAGAVLSAASSFIGGQNADRAQQSAAQGAAAAQVGAAQAGIDEQRRQFDKLQELLKPYVEAGAGAMGAQQGMLGLKGSQEQQAALTALEQSPFFQGLVQQGENALLQQASATGGLRGGNLQAALAQFRPNMLSQAFSDQFSRLGGLTQLGQASAAGQAVAGMGMAEQIANLLGEQGAARAGSLLATGQIKANRAAELGAMGSSYFGSPTFQSGFSNFKNFLGF